jgi:hypothetical protein
LSIGGTSGGLSGTPSISVTNVTASGTIVAGTTLLDPVNGVKDGSSLVLNPLLSTGADMCAQVSATFAAAIAAGYTSATVDARRIAYSGTQSCAASPFAGVSNNGTFTGILLTQNAAIVMANASLPVTVPGGVMWDGGGSRSLVNPPRAFAGTSIQPAASYTNGAILSLGAFADSSSPQGAIVRNLAIGCVYPGGTYSTSGAGAGTTGFLNAGAQENSGAINIGVSDCTFPFDWEANNSGINSAIDSMGIRDSFATLPYDTASIGLQIGGSSYGVAGLDHLGTFSNISITGLPNGSSPGPALGTCFNIEGSDVVLQSVRCAYTGATGIIGNTNSATNVTLINTGNAYSNVNNYLSTLITIGVHSPYAITLINVYGTGTTGGASTILTDASYAGSSCSVLQSSESGIAFYTKGYGGGSSQDVLSSLRTGCTTNGIFAGLFGNNNTFSGNNAFTGTTNTFNSNVKVASSTPATSGANPPSPDFQLGGNCWDSSASAACGENVVATPGSGANPNVYITHTDINTSNPVTHVWGTFTNPIRHDFFTMGLYDSSVGTYLTSFVSNATATRTVTLPDANSNTVQPLGSAPTGGCVGYIDANGVQQGATCGGGVGGSNLYQGYPASAVSGSGTDTAMFTYSMPGGTMAAGKCVEIKCQGTHASGTNTATLKIKWGSTTLFSAGNTTDLTGIVAVRLCNNSGVTNGQTSFDEYAFWGSGAQALGAPVTTSLDTTASQSITCTQNANAADTVTPQFMSVDAIR